MKTPDWMAEAEAATQRDPRSFPFGFLSGGSFVLDSSRMFSWFESPEALLSHLRDIMPLEYGIEPGPHLTAFQATLASVLDRARREGLTETIRLDLAPIIADFAVVDWWGAFDDLRRGPSETAVFIRSLCLDDNEVDRIPDDDDLDDFVQSIQEYVG